MDSTLKGITTLFARLGLLLLPLLGLLLLAGCGPSKKTITTSPPAPEHSQEAPLSLHVPEWSREAVFYQIFPERFRNGDPTNDPTRTSLEWPIEGRVPENWSVTRWTSNWYERAPWEKAMGDDFYAGVFDRRYGGDLQGVIDKLDYLDSLGINAIYFNPVFYARSLHKYDGNTYHHIDPHFGPDPDGDFALMAQETSDPSSWHVTAADSLFFTLIRQAHGRDIRIIIDGVFNHTGRDFFAFANLRERQEESPYRDWYIVRSFDDPATPDTNEFAYKGWWGVMTLPEFANNAAGTNLHAGPKAYIFDATRRWMDPNGDGDPSDGIDGWRLDVTQEVPIGFWQDWNAHVRRINSDVYTVTEIWEDAAQFLREGGFSATMNYYGFSFPAKGYLIDNALSPTTFARLLNERREEYPKPIQYALQNLLDSHDTPRLASMIVNRGPPYQQADRFDYDWGDTVSPRHTDNYDVSAPTDREYHIQRLTGLFQMTYVGAPMLYYGTEAGMWGADDPDDRKPMVWSDLQYESETDDPLGRPREADRVSFRHDLFDFYRNVIHLRNEHQALQTGGFDVLATLNERNVLAYSRTSSEEAFVIVINRSDEAHSLRVPLPETLRRHTFDVTMVTRPDASYRLQQDAEALLVEIEGLTGLVIQALNE